ncbi:CapA family protein [Staphylococcus sp. GSSP0090]|nr:CapA family protein [Staphylococcus sp. GSSP0090]
MWKYGSVLCISVLCFLVLFISCLNERENLTNQLSFYAVGDNLIHPVVYQDALQNNGQFNFKPMYDHLKEDIQSADISYINQESPIGGDERGLSGFKQFNTPEAIAPNLVDIGFNVVNGSNNHALDQGTAGLENEIDLWKQFESIFYFGTFNSQKERDSIPIVEKNGIKMAMLSYTYGTNDIPKAYPYQINYFNEKQIRKDIAKAKEKSDAVIVSAHWGNEGKQKPNAKQKRYAKVFADAGADVVLGTHPHVIQPIKWVEGQDDHKTLVAYSLGNFLNGQATGNEKNILGGNIRFNLEKNPKGVQVKQVKWQSLVTHYDLGNDDMNPKPQNFKMYPLDYYKDQVAQTHALNNEENMEVSRQRLVDITKDVIDNQYLDEHSY